MPLFSGQAMGTLVLVAVLTVVAIAFAVVGYVEWSSWAAMAEFISATSASDHSSESSTAVEFHNRRTGCPVGKRKLPTQLPTTPPRFTDQFGRGGTLEGFGH
jgi:hypothetical protein